MENTKANNLGILSKIPGIHVPPFVVLLPHMSLGEQNEIVSKFLTSCAPKSVAVRSSAAHEDSLGASFAGMYTTKLHVQATVEAVQVAAKEVKLSGKQKEEVVSYYATSRNVAITNTNISVIVQEMVEADMSGVMFSHDLAKDDGYYTVSVSGGVGENIVSGITNGELIRIVRGVSSDKIQDKWLQKLVKAMKSIEHFFGDSSLDIEFAVKAGQIYILQCRKITSCVEVMSEDRQRKLLTQVELTNAFIDSEFQGDILGDMIDINPVELLGVKPTPLDVSIFKHLFADTIVEQVRRDMGYDPLDIGLIRVVEGKPYVSMRASAFSIRPSGVSFELYDRMVSVYRNMLIKNPGLQSRVEFDLYAMSCGDKLEQVMIDAMFSECDKEQVRNAFDHLDNSFVNISNLVSESFEGIVREYNEKTETLSGAPLHVILQHVAVGTELFVKVARLAFYWKNKFEEIYPKQNLNELISGHLTLPIHRMKVDLIAYHAGQIALSEILRKYGHLRPGQFSVFGESYEDDPETYLLNQVSISPELQAHSHEFESTEAFKRVVMFMEAREKMKFFFARSFHLFAKGLKLELATHDISEQDASRFRWNELKDFFVSAQDDLMYGEGEEGVEMLLPDVLIPGSDLALVRFGEAMPTYITDSVVKARLCVLETLGVKADVVGAIVLLPNADPGYDFLFHSGAVGIITKVGGPASHMCIRSTELQMPACIGCGESLYQNLAGARSVLLDCSTQQIIALE